MAVELPDEVLVWKIGGGAANLRSWNNYQDKQGYNLFCVTNGKYLTYEKVDYGINLNFKDRGDNKTHFRVRDGLEREVLTGEFVAVGIGGSPSFLRYKQREWGINLDWSKAPVYEWQVLTKGAQPGEPIPENSPVALLNVKVEPRADFLVNFDRNIGSDIGWTTSPTFWDHLENAARATYDEVLKYLGF